MTHNEHEALQDIRVGHSPHATHKVIQPQHSCCDEDGCKAGDATIGERLKVTSRLWQGPDLSLVMS